MSKVDDYRKLLKSVKDLDAFLLKGSGLPGKRGNIELANAIAEEGDEKLFRRYVEYTPDKAPVNSPYEFLAFCGILGLGRMLAEGNMEILSLLRAYASDPRWRAREAVAMALQRFGAVDIDGLIDEMRKWSKGNALEKRAAAAALCEPALLKDPDHVVQVLHILDDITMWITFTVDRKSDEFITLRKGLGYCWSVAVAADPEEGKRAMEKWFFESDKDVAWIMRENLTKSRLARMDAAWVEQWKKRLSK